MKQTLPTLACAAAPDSRERIVMRGAEAGPIENERDYGLSRQGAQ